MKFQIDNKTFEGKFSNNKNSLQLALNKKYDKIFFIKWQNKSKNSMSKLEYIKDIECTRTMDNIILKNCYPIVSNNEDSVTIYYDYLLFTNHR